MVGDDFGDDVVGVEPPAHADVGAATPTRLCPVVDEVIQRLPQRPSAGPRPRRRLDRHARHEAVTGGAVEVRPGDRQVASRIAVGAAPEVDHPRQSSIAHDQIGAGDVAVHPPDHTSTGPPRLNECAPGTGPAGVHV